MQRRNFLKNTAAAPAALTLPTIRPFAKVNQSKIRLVQVGTGHRGTGFWGRDLLNNFKDQVEYAGVYDSNSGRSAFAQKLYGGSCKQYFDFDKMLEEARPDYDIITTRGRGVWRKIFLSAIFI